MEQAKLEQGSPEPTITIKLTLLRKGFSVSVYSREARTEYTVHAGIAPLSVASLVQEWMDVVAADQGWEISCDPLMESEIRSAQWSALRQGRTLQREEAIRNLRALKAAS